MNKGGKTCLAYGTGPLAPLGAVGNAGVSEPRSHFFGHTQVMKRTVQLKC